MSKTWEEIDMEMVLIEKLTRDIRKALEKDPENNDLSERLYRLDKEWNDLYEARERLSA